MNSSDRFVLEGTAGANTIGKFVNVSNLDSLASMTIILCGLIGFIAWNLSTWWLGIYFSSSYELVGNLISAVALTAEPRYVMWVFSQIAEAQTGVTKVFLSLIFSPIIGFCLGFGIHRMMEYLLKGARPIFNRYLRQFQWFSSSIAGIGVSKRTKADRWNTAKEIVSTWVVMTPGSVLLVILAYLVVQISTVLAQMSISIRFSRRR